MPRHLVPAVLVALATLAGAARAEEAPEPRAVSWATAQAADRTRLGRDHAARGDAEGALRAFLDAVGFDVTYGPAYLALGAIYEARGDAREAERALSMGIEHIPGFAEALVARGKLRAHVGREADAIADLEAAAGVASDSLSVLRELSAAYIASRALPAALAVARRRLALAETQGDARAAGEARSEARALATLIGEIDPVTAGGSGRGWVRRALWSASRRR